MVRITNLDTLNNLQYLTKNSERVSQSNQQLSSGLRIFKASIDAAGLSVANRLQTQVQGLMEAYDAAQSGVNLNNVADSSLSNIEENLSRIRELALKAANTGVYDQKDRQSIQDVINQNIEEIGRIANTTRFGSNYLLNGTFNSTAGVRAGTPDYGVTVDANNLTTKENFFNIRRLQEGAAQITAGNDAGTQVLNSGVQNQQDIAVTQATFNTGAGTAAAGDNLTNLTFNGVSLLAGGSITFGGVLADGATQFSGTFQLSAATDLAGGGGAGASLADAIQAAINQAETGAGINTTAGTNAGETNVSYNATTGRMEFRNGAEAGDSNFNVNFTMRNAAGNVQNTTGVTRAAEVGGAATGAQAGNSITAFTGNTFDTGQLTLQISDVTQAQARVVESNIAFQQAGGGAAAANTNLVGSVYNGVTLAQGDTITINGANADGSTFTNSITVSTVDGTAGNGAAVTLQDLMDELNVRDRTQPAGGTTNQSGFENATARLTTDGRIQLVDDVAGASRSNFTITVNDRSTGGGTFGTIVDQGNVVTAGNAQQATVRVNNGPTQRVTAGQQVTLYGRPNQTTGQPAPQITMQLGNNLTNGTDAINVTREEFAGSLNGGPEVRFAAGEQNVRFTNGLRAGETMTLDFDETVDVPGQGEGATGSVVISATGRQANFQIGAYAGERIGLRFGDMRPGALGLGKGQSVNDINVTTISGANEALSIIDQALMQVGSQRSQIGASTNRLETAANSLSVASENILASQSRILDLDYANEVSKQTTNELLLRGNIDLQIQSINLYNNMFTHLLR